MPTVRCGLEVLVHDQQALLQGRRVALLAHQASIALSLRHAASLLGDLRRVRLVRLLAPEHGLWGAAQDHARVGATRDPATGLPVFSLYGSRPAPTRAMLRGRTSSSWTFKISARATTPSFGPWRCRCRPAHGSVSRRRARPPNPLGGAVVEGNVPEPRLRVLRRALPAPARHGLTIGELAAYLNERHALGCNLTVAPLKGWRRAMLLGGHGTAVGSALAQHAHA